MEFINYSLVFFIFGALVLMSLLWRKLSSATSKLDQEIEGLRKWQQDHLPLEKWNDFLEHSVEGLGFGLIMINPDLTCAFMNNQAATLTSQQAVKVKGKRYQQVLAFVDEEGKPELPATDPVLHVFETRQPLEHQKMNVMVSGRPITVEVSWYPIYNQQQEVLGATAIITETTKQKALEEMKIDFVSIVSHELRTPITAIKGYIDILLQEVQLDPDHAEMLRRVYQSNERQLETVESLLNLSRLERGSIPIRPQEFQMEELINQVIAEVEPQARAKGLEIKFDYPHFALPKVWADPARAREVLMNLCTNAIKYTDQGWVKISAEANQTDMHIAVQDSGPGIAPEVQAKLFTKFQRGEGALTETQQGMGLGLYITRQFVELMGGKIWLESVVGQGSTFSVTLPLK